MKIYYGDESGFKEESSLAYGWQPAKEYIGITPKKSKRLNIFGLLSKHNHLQAYSSEQSMDWAIIITFLDDFASSLTQKTVLVLDNTPIDYSDEFKAKLAEWQARQLHIFYLPEPATEPASGFVIVQI